ncbi:hypothetical protein [Citrobacter braakii]|uniref:hypothetical protein n=1 Tax=Citrobacter braakii TaxID=57706 RepID=UPI001B84273D|nr:hypothetical protein [Citrobacter braakii]MBR7613144.1 hypothetical protein [Citrobacter braakii]
MKNKISNVVYRVWNPENKEHYFTDRKDQAGLAMQNGYEVSEYVSSEKNAPPTYQERRFQFIGKRQLEYWADVDLGTFQYLPKSERRIICIKGE